MTRRHTNGGDASARRAISITTQSARRSRTLTSVTPPNNPNIKIVALTLERPAPNIPGPRAGEGVGNRIGIVHERNRFVGLSSPVGVRYY